MAESRERIRHAAGPAKTGPVPSGTTEAEELLPPSPSVWVVGSRRRGFDTERFENGVEPPLVLVDLFASETKEDEEDVGEDRDDPERDAEVDGGQGVLFDEDGRVLVETVEVEVRVLPRDPWEYGYGDDIGQ